jgi:hypothetical protein
VNKRREEYNNHISRITEDRHLFGSLKVTSEKEDLVSVGMTVCINRQKKNGDDCDDWCFLRCDAV